MDGRHWFFHDPEGMRNIYIDDWKAHRIKCFSCKGAKHRGKEVKFEGR